MIKDPSEVIRPLRTLPDGVPVCLRTGPGDWRRESRKPDADRSSIVLARLLGLRFLEGRIPLLRANKRSQERSVGTYLFIWAVLCALTSFSFAFLVTGTCGDVRWSCNSRLRSDGCINVTNSFHDQYAGLLTNNPLGRLGEARPCG